MANRHWRLRAGVMIDTELHPSIEGTMQGGPLSPNSDSELTDSTVFYVLSDTCMI